MLSKGAVAVIAVATTAAVGAATFGLLSRGDEPPTENIDGVANVSVVQDSTISDLAPGGLPANIDFTIINGVDNEPVAVNGVSIAVESSAPGCSPDNFSVTQPLIGGEEQPVVFTGSRAFRATGATITMRNTSWNQDACKNVAINLVYTVA